MKMSKIKYAVLIYFLLSQLLFGQGMSRSHGIGVRANFWNITGRAWNINFNSKENESSVDIGGAGATLYFFSRMHNRLFLDLSLGAIAAVKTNTITSEQPAIKDTVRLNMVMPFLLGVRYDLLPTRLSTRVQPYVSFGAGIYWAQVGDIESDVQTYNNDIEIDPNVEAGGNLETEFLPGFYAGIGANIIITDWAALNFDARYHITELKLDKKYDGLDFGIGFSFMWGKKRELFNVRDIKLVVNDIYPAYYQFYNSYPLALVSVENTAGHAIEVNIKSSIPVYSSRVSESGFISIAEGETKDIPVTVILGSEILKSPENKPATLDIAIEGRAGRTDHKTMSAPIIIHSRNAWNGDTDKLVYFVTPSDETVLHTSREIVKSLDLSSGNRLENFEKARAVFEHLQKSGMRYQADPNIPYYRDDRVQYARETLSWGSGDCDDLVVLYASLLEGLGISTAFVDVQSHSSEIAHLYLLFDSGLDADEGHLISSNDKRYVIRNGMKGRKTIWIPVETTLVNAGFEEAWKEGAQAYLQDAVFDNGLAEGWMQVIDIN